MNSMLNAIDIKAWKKYEMLNPNSHSMPNVGNLTSEASVGQNDPVTDLIENAQSLGRFSRNDFIGSEHHSEN